MSDVLDCCVFDISWSTTHSFPGIHYDRIYQGCHEVNLNIVEELVVKHLVTNEWVMEYLSVAPARVVRQACILHDYGFSHDDILQALKCSEATTARGIAVWIMTKLKGRSLLDASEFYNCSWFRDLPH